MCCKSRPLMPQRRNQRAIRTMFFGAKLIIALVALIGIGFTVPICAAADAPTYLQRDYPVRPAGGVNAGAPQSPGNSVVRTTHIEVESPQQATANDKLPPLSPPHANALAEKSSSGPRTMGAIVTVAASLAVVLGLFWLCAWLMRRGLPSSARRLPPEVVDVLGRAPLAGRQQMHVLRFGNKLLLVCISSSGVDTLGEITDPAEIDRLAGLCEQLQPQSATTAFQQIFGQLASDRKLKNVAIGKVASAKEAADV